MIYQLFKFKITALLLTAAMLFSFYSCNEDSSTTPSTNEQTRKQSNFTLAFYGEPNSADNSLIITEAKFVLRQMNIKVSYGETEYNLKEGPFIVSIDVNGRVIITVVAELPIGSYHRLKFQLHKPTPNEIIDDNDFIESNNKRYSVVVKGFYNGVPFIYKSGVTAAKGIDIENSPIIITVGNTVNITMSINPYQWFNSGGFLDPTDENNRHEIDRNIQESFKRVFRDMDYNGQPD